MEHGEALKCKQVQNHTPDGAGFSEFSYGLTYIFIQELPGPEIFQQPPPPTCHQPRPPFALAIKISGRQQRRL